MKGSTKTATCEITIIALRDCNTIPALGYGAGSRFPNLDGGFGWSPRARRSCNGKSQYPNGDLTTLNVRSGDIRYTVVVAACITFSTLSACDAQQRGTTSDKTHPQILRQRKCLNIQVRQARSSHQMEGSLSTATSLTTIGAFSVGSMTTLSPVWQKGMACPADTDPSRSQPPQGQHVQLVVLLCLLLCKGCQL